MKIGYLLAPRKIRHQFRLGAIVSLMGILLFVGYVQYSYYRAKQNVEQNLHHIQPAVTLLEHLSRDLNIATTKIGFYLVTQEESYFNSYRTELAHVSQEIDRLGQFSLMQSDYYQSQIVHLRALVEEVYKLEQELVSVTLNETSNQPALVYARNNLNPIAVTLFQLINDAVRSEKDKPATPERKKILSLFHEIDNNWLNVTNWLRAFLAYRNEGTINEVQKYLKVTIEKNLEAAKWGNSLTLEQETAVEEMIVLLDDYQTHLKTVYEMHTGPNWRKDAVILRSQLEPLMSKIDATIEALSKKIQTEFEKNTLQTTGLMDTSVVIIFVSGVIGLILTLLAMLWAKLKLISPLNQTVNAMRTIAHEGNLSHELDLKSKDEFGDLAKAFNEFVSKIHTVVDLVIQSSENLVSESDKLSKFTSKSKEQSQHQKDKVQNVAQEFSGIAHMLNDVMEKTSDTQQVVKEAETTANQGGQVVDTTVHQIQQLASQINSAADTMLSLENMSHDIGNIIGIITGITEQTNLLALNAAIEAARAGEAGRGFAVVADEVRSLSSSVTEQTRQIQSQIEAIQHTAKQATILMQQSQEGAQHCVRNAEQAGQSLTEIKRVISQVSSNSHALANASANQIGRTSSVNEDIQTIHNIAIETADGAQQVSNMGFEFKILASQLESLVSQLLLGLQKKEITETVKDNGDEHGPGHTESMNDNQANPDGDIELF